MANAGFFVLLAVGFYGVLAVMQLCSTTIDCIVSEVGKIILTLVIVTVVMGWFKWYHGNAKNTERISVEGKAVFITGCDSGFGFETALQLYCAGYHVFAGCLEPGINGALTLSKVDGGRRLVLIPLDVASKEQLDHAYHVIHDICQQQELQLWAVINNACSVEFFHLEISPLEVFKRMLDTNTLDIVRVTRRFLPLLRQSEGRILIINSLAGCQSYPGLFAYGTTKEATLALAECVRAYAKKWNISVTVINCAEFRTHPLNTSKLMHDLEHHWDAAPEDVRDAYDEEQYKHACEEYIKCQTGVRSNTGEAVDTIVKACEAVVPREEYHTCLKSRLFALTRLLPREHRDTCMATVERLDPFFAWFPTKSRAVPTQFSQLLHDIRGRSDSIDDICDTVEGIETHSG